MTVGGSGLSWTAGAPDPVLGTWTLNLAKSKFTPGPAPKSTTRTYTQTAQGTSLTVSGVAADGSPISIQTTYNYHGKDYPYAGSLNYNSLSSKRVNGSTVKSVLKKEWKSRGVDNPNDLRARQGHDAVDESDGRQRRCA
jgi:hypothetical protein